MLPLAIHRISDTKAILTIVCPIKIIDDNTNKSLLHYYGKYEKNVHFSKTNDLGNIQQNKNRTFQDVFPPKFLNVKILFLLRNKRLNFKIFF